MTYTLYIRDLKCIYCMKNNDNDLVSFVLSMCLKMRILFLEIKDHISERKHPQHYFSNLNKTILKQIELSSHRLSRAVNHSLIDRVW